MEWEQIAILLRVIEQTRDYPKLVHIHNRALAELEAADPNTIHFAGQVDQLEPLEDEE